jgi:acetoin utilization deacetylase AcuC-like enzyme
MNFGYRETCLEHETGPRHPESPDRLRAIRRGLTDARSVRYVDAESASREQVTAIHDEGYVDDVESFCADGGGNWDGDTVAVSNTWEAALASAGLAEWTARSALAGADGRDTPFSIGRPPGHHAVADDAMGFCFFNNAAVATQSAIDSGDAKRVAIIDWDVHHGNGTQDLFYNRSDVFYASIHEDDLYPETGQVAETGTGPGEGTTLNVPFPPGTTHKGFLTALDDPIRPALLAFDPELLLISAGFDAHEHDPISRMRVSTEGYGRLAAGVRDLALDADAALGFILEGGYGLETLSDSIRMVHEVFDGYQPVSDDAGISDDAEAILETVREQDFDGV